jgi:hypothetical protein
MTINNILASIDSEIASLQRARALLVGKAVKVSKRKATKPTKVKRTMSAAGRKAIADAQRKRWAEKKKAAK